VWRRALPVIVALVAACSGRDQPRNAPTERIRFWHTFNPTETEALNEVLSASNRGMPVEPTLLPFARGQTIISEVLRSGDDCPDLVRVDATWLPALARAELLVRVPDQVASARTWLPEAAELARDRDLFFGVPQALDGLALIYRKAAVREAGVPWPPQTVRELVATAHRLTRDGHHGLGVRVDGYWFAAFLRAWGGDVLDPDSGALGVDSETAVSALNRFAELFGPTGISPSPPPSGDEDKDEARRFRTKSLAVVVNGPWAITGLAEGRTDELAVAPFPPDAEGRPAAPRGGHVLVVPRCARRPEAAWQLALEITAPSVQADWAQRFGVVPTAKESLAGAGALAQQFYEALGQARPLPRHPVTSEIFDDLNPAIAAVVAGDATAEEALAGVTRAWRRLLGRHSIAPQTQPPSAPDAGAPTP